MITSYENSMRQQADSSHEVQNELEWNSFSEADVLRYTFESEEIPNIFQKYHL